MNYFSPQQYRGSIYHVNSFFHWVNALRVRIPHEGKGSLLDAGCGDGAISELMLLNNPNLHVTGFDASAKQIEGATNRCQAHHHRSHFVTATFDSILTGPNKILEPFDVVIANYSLHLAPSMERAVGNLAKCLKPGVSAFSSSSSSLPIITKLSLHTYFNNCILTSVHTIAMKPSLSLSLPPLSGRNAGRHSNHRSLHVPHTRGRHGGFSICTTSRADDAHGTCEASQRVTILGRGSPQVDDT
jgi:ubiquinone/menaquinone biosynthesis C-methylase UbiE